MINGHGDDLYHYEHTIHSNFSSNVYNHSDHQKLFERLMKNMGKVCSYPEPEPLSLEQAFAKNLHISNKEVCVTNGATESIYLIAQAFKGKKSAIWMPTFSEYADACQLHGHKILPFYTIDSLPSEAQLVWLCNPNNPTGEARSLKVLREWIETHPQKIFIIDQSYEMFTLQRVFTSKEGVQFPNVILIHSLTKHYAIPGIRIGYMTAYEALLREIRLQRMPWSVNSLAIEAGFYAIEEKLQPTIDIPLYLKEKERLEKALLSTEMMEIWHSDTHFMLIRLRYGKASALKDYLANEHGILIRDASNFEGLDEHFFRIATQTPEENDQLVKAIQQWISSI